MYFTAKLSIDPSQATRIEQVTPKNIFGQLVLYLSSGKVTKEEEHETFCAVAILQQFNAVFKNLRIDNIIRLTKDKTDYYFDEEGREGDIAEAFQSFAQKVENTEEDLFQNLYLVLEHETSELFYLIQIRISRKHRVGEYPIEIILNATLNDFSVETWNETTIKELRNKLWWDFDTQEKYDAIIEKSDYTFHQFVEEARTAMQEFIGVDDIVTSISKSIIYPRQAVNKSLVIPFHRAADLEPIFHGYFGVAQKALYAWLWSEVCFERDIKVSKTLIVNDRGGVLVDLEESEKEKISLKSGIDLEHKVLEKNKTKAEVSFSFSNLWDELPNNPRSEYSFLENKRYS